MSDSKERFDEFMRESEKYVTPTKLKTAGQFYDEAQPRNMPIPATVDYGVSYSDIEEAVEKYVMHELAGLEGRRKQRRHAELLRTTYFESEVLHAYYGDWPLQELLQKYCLTNRRLGLLRKKYGLPGVQKRLTTKSSTIA